MKEPTKERWLELCEAATNEHDPRKLLLLTEEIYLLLNEKEERRKLQPTDAA